ncbi:MAG: phosphatase PAP2 family protein [Bdellovibrionia bacterium]
MKPILIALFLLGNPAHASVFDDHVTPSLLDGFDHTGLWIAAGGLLATTLAQSQDYKMREEFSENKRVPESTTKIGDFLGTGVPGALTALIQLSLDPEMGAAHAEALIDTMIVTSALKYSAGRGRPDSDNHHSMPSGHTSTTFATATSLAYAYGWKTAVPLYMAAVFTGVTRMSDDAHWFSDTVAGATVGLFWGRATYFHHAAKKEKADSEGSAFLPVLTSKYAGLIWKFRF